MKHLSALILAMTMTCCSTTPKVIADGINPAVVVMESDAPVKAFPGAEGFGANAIGGRGGKVLHVTNLNDSEEGSLRWAINQEGPRTVVFDVSGIIDIEERLIIKHPNITIAGQTAPGDGICIRGETLQIKADHVIIRYLRLRLGDGMHNNGSLQGKDAVWIARGENIIVDHCSVSWSLDELLSTSSKRPDLSNVTVQWCYITEALNPSKHGFGSLIRGTGGAKFSYLYNLYAHNYGRNPRPGNYNSNPHTEDPEGMFLDFRNNLIYNWGGSKAGYNKDDLSVTKLNYINNYLIPGVDSKNNGTAYKTGSPYNQAFFHGNYYDGKNPENQWELVGFNKEWTAEQVEAYKKSVPFHSEFAGTMDAVESSQQILLTGGAALPVRDIVDQRIVASVKNKSGKIIKSQQDVGGWPELKSLEPPKDSDQDGMPDEWEKQNNLNKDDYSDAQKIEKNGYTALENYLNSLTHITDRLNTN